MPILAIYPSTRGLHNLRKRVFRDGTDTHAYGHGNSMTESAQWANSVKTSWGSPVDRRPFPREEKDQLGNESMT